MFDVKYIIRRSVLHFLTVKGQKILIYGMVWYGMVLYGMIRIFITRLMYMQ